jgi:hypothetical protein
MRNGRFLQQFLGAAALLAGLSGVLTDSARAQPADFVLSCENGRTYPIRARAVSVTGDLVTGYVGLGKHRSVHIRLAPMGSGYRYFAKGVWIDGWRGEGEITFWPGRPIPCSVARGS